MTAPLSQHHEYTHITDLLPAYLTGQLETDSARLVREHLLACSSCRRELAEWQATQEAIRQVYAASPQPSSQLMDQVWTRITARETVPVSWRQSPLRTLRRLWLVFRAQISLIHKSLWIASILVCLFALVLIFFIHPHTPSQREWSDNLLVLCIVIVGASGSAFLYGTAVDPGFELSLATPTSLRFIMLCRVVIVLGYNILLGMLTSAIFATLYGGGLWNIVHLWLGQLLFLSSLGLTISLFCGSVFAVICTAIVEILQAFPASLLSHLGLNLASLDLGPTSPVLLLGSLLLLVCALGLLPRQPRAFS